jgi:hypothetical protein
VFGVRRAERRERSSDADDPLVPAPQHELVRPAGRLDPHHARVGGISLAGHEAPGLQDAHGLRHRRRADTLGPRKRTDRDRSGEDDHPERRAVLRREA